MLTPFWWWLMGIGTLGGFAIGFFVLPSLVRLCTAKVLGGRAQLARQSPIEATLITVMEA